ncbi:MAG: proline--tRNA ligase [Dehalococcoidia bacterium]|nr:proline--tRNA ligase [Dehalococcoidia bacterium]
MRISQLFGKRLREIPSEADTESHRLLLRTGMISQLAAGVYSYMPLALKTLRKIENIVRDEMNHTRAQEILMPTLQPVELWQKSGRFIPMGETLFCLKDRKERNLVLGPTHEEVVTDLAKRNVQSYRDLPFTLYQIQTKMRDEPRPRGGLIRVREFTMKDAYSFHANETELDATYLQMVQAYKNVYRRCGLPVIMIEADSGAIGGKDSQEFMAVTEIGEDEIIVCDGCNNGANVEKAVSIKPKPDCQPLLELEEIQTYEHESIEQLTSFLRISANQTLKAVLYHIDGEVIFVVVRGDLDVNEIKLKKVLNSSNLRLASDDEVKNAGIIAGSASPIGLRDIRIVADESIASGTNYVVGANKKGYHFKNANYPRDFQAEVIADIAKAKAGDTCHICGGTLRTIRGMEVGHVFKLGISISEKIEASYADENGELHPIIMGCYGIGIGRLMAAIIELNHDDKGIIWPLNVAPFQIYLCPLFMDNPVIKEKAECLYNELIDSGYEVLFDDRTESPGVKFNDADLLGIPLRITISPRSLEKGSAEIKLRQQAKSELVALEDILTRIKALLGDTFLA